MPDIWLSKWLARLSTEARLRKIKLDPGHRQTASSPQMHRDIHAVCPINCQDQSAYVVCAGELATWPLQPSSRTTIANDNEGFASASCDDVLTKAVVLTWHRMHHRRWQTVCMLT
jgi:hypothetical protein